MFYELLDKYTIKKAPYPLHIEYNDVFTNDEKIYNKQGYYALVRTDYPQDGKAYESYYAFEDNKIIQKWEEVEEAPTQVSALDDYIDAMSTVTSFKEVREASQQYQDSVSEVSNEG